MDDDRDLPSRKAPSARPRLEAYDGDRETTPTGASLSRYLIEKWAATPRLVHAVETCPYEDNSL